MPERRDLIKKPAATGPIMDGPGEPNSFDSFLAGILGDQLPGDGASAAGAAATMLPLGQLLKRLGVGKGLRGGAGAPANLGDALLRDHAMGMDDAKNLMNTSPRLREFVPVGDEAFAVPGATGPDALEEAYKRLLAQGGRLPLSPPGSGPKPALAGPKPKWPTDEDVKQLKRRKLESGRPLDVE